MNAAAYRQNDFECDETKRLIVLGGVLLLVFFGRQTGSADEKQPQAVKEQPVRIDGRRIDVVVDLPKGLGQPCRARVRVTYRMTNPTDKPLSARQQFPVLTTPLRKADEKAFRVRVGDKPVAIEIERVSFAPRAKADEAGRLLPEPIPGPTKEQTDNWSRMLDEWTKRDPELRERMAKYKQLSSTRGSLNTLIQEFDEEVAKHLIDEEVRYAARYVAKGDGAMHNLVKLMPEVDSSLRYDIEFQRWKYVSYLNEHDSESYRPYQQKWQRQAEMWFQSKPKLAELTPKLRAAWESHRQAQALLSGEIVKLLHDQCGLSHEDALAMRGFYTSPTYFPPKMVELLKKLFPKVRREREEFANEVASNMTRWGFGDKLLSPITGDLYPAALQQHRSLSFFYQDPTIDANASNSRSQQTSKGSKTNSSAAQLPPGRYWQAVGWPHLLTFEVPLTAKGKADVVVEYEVPVQPLEHPFSGKFGISPAVSQLVIPLDPLAKASNVDVSFSVPDGLQPIISPSPEKMINEKDKRRVFQMRLKSSRQSLYMMLIDFRTPQTAAAYLSRFRADRNILTTVQQVEAATKNRTVTPLLKAAQYLLLLREGRGLEAHKLLLQLEKTNTDFVGFESLQKQSEISYRAKEARRLYEWIERKSQSPKLEGDDDFNRFQRRSTHDSYVLDADGIAELAKNVQALNDADLSIDERLGRRFVLCQAGIDRQDNLAKLLQMADSDYELTMRVLRLLKALTVEKPEALPFVLGQIADAKREKKRVATSDPPYRKLHAKYNAGYYALCTFRSRQAAPRLIEFIRSSDGDSLLIQGTVSALSRMTLPALFEDLIEIAGPVARSSESAFYQYLDLLIRSKPAESVAVLRRLRREHPKYTPRFNVLLSDQGDQLELPAAVETYNSAADDKSLSAAVHALKSFGDPKVVGRLKYRSGLEKWINESVLDILRQNGGGKDAYPFVEKYYHEFVKGQKAFQHLECVAAFEAIGDARAIPYLKEIIQTTERKQDAAQAIGSLMLPLRIERPRDTHFYELNACVNKVQNPHAAAEERDAALKVLLEDPYASMQIIVKHGRVRDLLSGESSSLWQPEDKDRLKYLSQFGDVAARHLLESARGCSLTIRYQLANLMSLIPAESRKLLREAAANPNGDVDQRRTAILALGTVRDENAVAVLGDLLEVELLRGNVIDALTNIGNAEAIQVLQKLKRKLEAANDSTPRCEVWLAKLERASP